MMMRDIALSLEKVDEEGGGGRGGGGGGGSTANLGKHSRQSSSASLSPADLHGMWYPTVRRTLVTLSKLYRCVDKSIFQVRGLQKLAEYRRCEGAFSSFFDPRNSPKETAEARSMIFCMEA